MMVGKLLELKVGDVGFEPTEKTDRSIYHA